MTTPEGRILVVDDDPTFQEVYLDFLRSEGYLAEVAPDRAAALARLDAGGYSAILLDQKLQGPGGPDGGLDLIDEARIRCPGAKILVITGYATTQSIERAFESGAYDFLEKTATLLALLRIKLRGAQALYRAQSARAPGDAALRRLWRDIRESTDANRKGKLLEDFVAALFRSLPELGSVADVRRKNDIEEIDLILQNDSTAPPWRQEGSYFLVECKHWSSPVGRSDYDVFHRKLERARGRCTLGFLFAPGGFSAPMRECLRRDAIHGAPYVIPLDHAAIDALLAADDRLAHLSRLHMNATVGDAAGK